MLRTLSRLRRQGSARGQHSCCRAVRVVTLAAKISFLVGRFSFLVPLFFFFFCLPLLVTAFSSLLGQQLALLGLPACHISSSPCKGALCPVTSPSQPCHEHSAFQHHSFPPSPALGSPQHFTVLPISATSQGFSPSLRRCGIKREEAFAFVLGGYLRLPVA